MNRVLIIDFSEYRDELVRIFSNMKCSVVLCDSAFDAMSKLKAYDFDLVVSQVELPGDNAFDLYNYISRNYPFIPAIMTTGRDIDTFFDRIFEEGIGNVIGMPPDEHELRNLAQKLITRENIFGLKNYISGITETKRISITGSKQIQKAIHALFETISSWGVEFRNKMALNLVLNEMIINAVYHSHGLTQEKEERKPVQLEKGQCVDLFFARSEDKIGIAIDDYNGKLSSRKILDSINRAVEQENLIQEAFEKGEDVTDLVSETGRGIDLVRKLAGDYYFIIKEKFRTEIMLVFDIEAKQDETGRKSSLKIIEDR